MSKKMKDSYEILQASLENLQKINQELSLESAESKARLRTLERENSRLTERCTILEQGLNEIKEGVLAKPVSGDAFSAHTERIAHELLSCLSEPAKAASDKADVEIAKCSADMIIRRAEAERNSMLASARLESDRIIGRARDEVRRLYKSMETTEEDIVAMMRRLGRLQGDISDTDK